MQNPPPYSGMPGSGPPRPGGPPPPIPQQQFAQMSLQQPPHGLPPQQYPMSNGPPPQGGPPGAFRPPAMGMSPGMPGPPGHQPYGAAPPGGVPPPFGQPPPGPRPSLGGMGPPPGGMGAPPGAKGLPPGGIAPPPGAMAPPPGGIGPPPGAMGPPPGGMGPPPMGAMAAYQAGMRPPPGAMGPPPPGGMGPPPPAGFAPPGPPRPGMGMGPPPVPRPGAPFPPPGPSGPPPPGGFPPPMANGAAGPGQWPPAPQGPQGPPGGPGDYTMVGANGVPPFAPPAAAPRPSGSPGASPMGAPSRPSSNTQRIDPSQIPRPPLSTNNDVLVFETRVQGAHNPPYGALTQYVVRDCGTCSPRYMRSTLNAVPHTAELLNLTAMPFAVVVQPMALPDPGDDPIQVVDFGETGPVRCSRCKAYMNPYMRFTNNGRSFVCNFCGLSNDCPESYYAYMGADGRRRDADERPELCRGTVEVVATKDYLVRPPMPPTHFFLIDVTATAVSSGATAAVCAAVLQALDSLQGGDTTLVGFATFDSTIHFYGLRPDLSQASMMVVSDVDEVYAPLSQALLGQLSQCRGAVEALLKNIPTMFAGSRTGSSCAGAALEAAIEAVKPTGGKVHAFITSLPSVGVHSLKPRQAPSGEKAEKEKLTYLQSQDNTLKTVAAAAADYQVCVDLFFLTHDYVDVASLSDLTHTTGGSIYHYCPWSLMDADQLLNDLRWNVSRPQALEAVMRVRCSTGLEVESYYGSFHRPNATDVQLPAIDSDKAIIAKLLHSEKLPPSGEVYLQCALLYTTTDGQRRIRLHTLALPVSDVIGNVFKGADLDAQITMMARKAAATLPGGNLVAARESVTSHTVSLLYSYRKYCVTSSSNVQLVLPEALKLLPLYAVSLQKSAGLRPEARLDERAMWVVAAMTLPVTRVVPMLYPRMIAVHRLIEACPDGKVDRIPEGVTLTAEMLDTGGVYLLENGIDAMLFLDKAVPRELLRDLTGYSQWEDLSAGTAPLGLQSHSNLASAVVHDLLARVRLQRAAFMRLRVMRKGDNSEVVFYNALTEDRSPAGKSYVEYLCEVHRLIQQKFQ